MEHAERFDWLNNGRCRAGERSEELDRIPVANLKRGPQSVMDGTQTPHRYPVLTTSTLPCFCLASVEFHGLLWNASILLRLILSVGREPWLLAMREDYLMEILQRERPVASATSWWSYARCNTQTTLIPRPSEPHMGGNKK